MFIWDWFTGVLGYLGKKRLMYTDYLTAFIWELEVKLRKDVFYERNSGFSLFRAFQSLFACILVSSALIWNRLAALQRYLNLAIREFNSVVSLIK